MGTSKEPSVFTCGHDPVGFVFCFGPERWCVLCLRFTLVWRVFSTVHRFVYGILSIV